MPELIKNFIAGRWSDAGDGRRFTSRNPADSRNLVAEAPLSGRADVDLAVAAARAAFSGWRLMPAPRRGEILFRAGELLRHNKQRLGELVTREMGKVITEGAGRCAGGDRHRLLHGRRRSPAAGRNRPLGAAGQGLQEHARTAGGRGAVGVVGAWAVCKDWAHAGCPPACSA